MRIPLVLLLSVALTSCVHAHPFYGPSGEQGFVVTCNGAANSMAGCYNKAHEECHGPYHVVSGQNDQRVGYNYYNGNAMAVDHREITVVCGAEHASR